MKRHEQVVIKALYKNLLLLLLLSLLLMILNVIYLFTLIINYL